MERVKAKKIENSKKKWKRILFSQWINKKTGRLKLYHQILLWERKIIEITEGLFWYVFKILIEKILMNIFREYYNQINSLRSYSFTYSPNILGNWISNLIYNCPFNLVSVIGIPSLSIYFRDCGLYYTKFTLEFNQDLFSIFSSPMSKIIKTNNWEP